MAEGLGSMTDPELAAVMVMLLEDQQAADLLAQLDPKELRLLGEKMCALGEIGPVAIAQSITGFVERTERLGLTAHDRVGQVRDLMTRAVGEVKAVNLMHRIAPEAAQDTSALELARWLNPEVLIPLVRGEHPQAIAVLLVQIDPEVAAAVLHGLPETIQTQVVHRIATLGKVSAEALRMLEEVLTRRIVAIHSRSALTMGGPREAAEIINVAAKAVEKRVMPELTKMDKALAKEIENEMFKFEHLYVLDAQSMGAMLREVDSDTLIAALKGIEEPQREVFFRAMSSRAADGVRDEIAARGRLKRAEVTEAQKAMITAARRLSAEGVIVFGSGDDDYV
ncbi:flagellar motor switch protein FliG [Novosphingobium capsulatum]|nr:flagellar motor switch protein FliG [Novosphingobium capsulatum]WQD92973.1 flagellar motor switch protein FliG [Novosphingobium capsulatum]